MASWKLCAAIVCLYGFLKAMKPSEAFLNPYLLGPPIYLNNSDLYNQVYPVWTYSYLVALIPVFLLTDLLRYKAVIVFEALCYIGTWLMLLFGRGVLTMQFMQFLYGLCTATEIAYYAYIYAVVESQHYRRVAGYTRGAILTGKFVAAVIGQLLVSFNAIDLYRLNFISLASVTASLIAAICLPKVQHSMYFHVAEQNTKEMRNHQQQQEVRNEENGLDNPAYLPSNDYQNNLQEGPTDKSRADSDVSQDNRDNTDARTGYFPIARMPTMYADIDASSLAWSTQSDQFSRSSVSSSVAEDLSESMKRAHTHQEGGLLEEPKSCLMRIKGVALTLWKDFLATYSKKILLIWSIWWAIASCGNFQVGNYVQSLWKDIDPQRNNSQEYNGAVEAAATLMGAVSSFCIGHVPANWTAYGELLLGVVSLVNCGVLFVMAYTRSIWVAYCLYAVFRAAYQLVITVATFQIARYLDRERFGLVFGINTFLALLLETILTAIVVDKRGLGASITTQFAVNGGYFGIMGLIFFVAAVVNLSRRGCVSCRAEEVPVTSDAT